MARPGRPESLAGSADLPAGDVPDVLLRHQHRRGATADLRQGLVGDLHRRHPVAGYPLRPARLAHGVPRPGHRWRGQHGVAAGAADRLDVPVPLAARGFRLHGPRGLRHGPPDAGAGPAGQVVRAADRRFRLQRTVDHGRADPGRAARAADYHHDGAVHVLRRAPGDLRRIRWGLLRPGRRAGDLLPLPARHRRGDPHRAVAQAHFDARRGLAVRHGTAAVPCATP